MTSDLGPDGLQQVLRHERGLRRLARVLLADPADADDAVQHALTQAAMGRCRPGTPLWSFLCTTLRRHASNLRKFAARRRARERLAARGEATPSADAFVARDQLRRCVADAVLALEDPYRTTVWLRWFEELDPADVASRMNVPVATVRTRLQRAHVRLAARLDRQYGDRQGWAVLALPLPSGASVVAITWGVAMKTVLAAAAVLLVLSLAWQLRPGPAASPPVTTATAGLPRVVAAELPAGAGERQQVEVRPSADARRDCVVQFADGTPARGLPVWFWLDDATRPAWTRRVDAKTDREVGKGAVNASGEAEPPEPVLFTDGDGRVVLPPDASRAAIVSVQYAVGQQFSAPCPGPGMPFVLPALGCVDVGLRGAPAGGRWSILYTPALRDADGSTGSYVSLRENVEAPAGPGVLRMQERRHELDVRDRLQAWFPLDHLLAVDVDGHGFEVRLVGHEEAFVVVPVPAVIDGECTRCLPRLEILVVEPGGEPTKVVGHCQLDNAPATTASATGVSGSWSEQRRQLVGGAAAFDEVELVPAAAYGVTVLLADGEWMRLRVTFRPEQGVQHVRLQRGEGRQPIRLRLPGEAAASVSRVAVGSRDTVLVAEPLANFYTASTPVFAISNSMVAVSLLPDDWRTCWIVLTDGRVGTVDRVPFAVDVADVAWLPAGASQTIDVAQLYREHGDRELMAASLEVELVDSRGLCSWLCLASHRRFHKAEPGPLPTWCDLHLPATLRSRLRVFASDDADAGFGQPLAIPLPRR